MKLTDYHKEVLAEMQSNIRAAEQQLKTANEQYSKILFTLAGGPFIGTYKIEGDELIINPEVKEEAK